MPIAKVDRTLTVAIADPTAIVSDELKHLTGLSITLMIAADGATGDPAAGSEPATSVRSWG